MFLQLRNAVGDFIFAMQKQFYPFPLGCEKAGHKDGLHSKDFLASL